MMIVNHERNPTAIGRRADELPRVRGRSAEALGREPTHAELAQKLSVTEADILEIEAAAQRGYHNGGFKIYDVSKPAQPKLIVHQRTGGIGVHRFDMDERYAYISTEMEGFVGNILVIYDIAIRRSRQEVSRWWMPGQHIAGGEKPSWPGRQHRLHHALRYGDEMWASCWHGGFRIVDVSDIAQPKTVGSYNYHPLFPEPTHTVLPVPRRSTAGASRSPSTRRTRPRAPARRRRGAGARMPACWLFDVTDPAAIKPLAHSGERSRLAVQPHARRPLRRPPVRRAHDAARWSMRSGSAAACASSTSPTRWRRGGRLVHPRARRRPPAPQSNDVTLDDRGLIYLVDRNVGFDILEFNGYCHSGASNASEPGIQSYIRSA